MSFVLDGAILLIIFLTIYIYYKRGFVKAVLGFGKTLFAFVSALLFGKSAGTFLAEKYFDEKLTDMVYNKLSEYAVADGASLAEKIPSSLRLLAEQCGANVEEIISNAGHDGEWLHDVSASIALPISSVISHLIGYVAVFVAAYLVFLLGAFILESVVELPILRTVNRFLGICLGCLCAIMFVSLFVFIVKAIIYYIVASGDKEAAIEVINNTHLFKFFSGIGKG